MANQPQDMKAFKGQINFNSGATPPKSVTDKAAPIGPMKRMQHKKKMDAHNQKTTGG